MTHGAPGRGRESRLANGGARRQRGAGEGRNRANKCRSAAGGSGARRARSGSHAPTGTGEKPPFTHLFVDLHTSLAAAVQMPCCSLRMPLPAAQPPASTPNLFLMPSLFKKIELFVYFWLRWVFLAVRGLSLVAGSRGYSLMPCTGFSLCGSSCELRALEPGLQ